MRRRRGRLLDARRCARVDAAAYPLVARALARVRHAPVRQRRRVAAYGRGHRRRAQRGVGDRAARSRTCARSTIRRDKLEIVVTSDASTDATDELAEAAARASIRNPRGGKVAAQDNAVRETAGEIVAFSDANCTWAPDALRKLVRNFADPDVAYVCGRLNIQDDDGRNKEGVYWRYELALRADESRLDSVTGGNGSIYAVRRDGLRRGRPALRPRSLVAVPDGAARAPRRLRAGGERLREGDADERGRVPAQGAHVRALLGDRRRGQDAAALRPLYLRRGDLAPPPAVRERVLHLVLLGSNVALLGQGIDLRRRPRASARRALAALVGVGIAAVLRARHVGDRRRALELPAARRSDDVGRRRRGRGEHAERRADA